MPLTLIASMDHVHDLPVMKLIAGMLETTPGQGGVLAIGTLAVLGFVAGGFTIAWHFLGGATFALKLVGTDGMSSHLEVEAGTQTDELIELVELVSGQLRVIDHAQTVAPPAMPATQQEIVVRS